MIYLTCSTCDSEELTVENEHRLLDIENHVNYEIEVYPSDGLINLVKNMRKRISELNDLHSDQIDNYKLMKNASLAIQESNCFVSLFVLLKSFINC